MWLSAEKTPAELERKVFELKLMAAKLEILNMQFTQSVCKSSAIALGKELYEDPTTKAFKFLFDAFGYHTEVLNLMTFIKYFIKYLLILNFLNRGILMRCISL